MHITVLYPTHGVYNQTNGPFTWAIRHIFNWLFRFYPAVNLPQRQPFSRRQARLRHRRFFLALLETEECSCANSPPTHSTRSGSMGGVARSLRTKTVTELVDSRPALNNGTISDSTTPMAILSRCPGEQTLNKLANSGVVPTMRLEERGISVAQDCRPARRQTATHCRRR